MVTGGLISPLDVTTLPVCEPCLEEKMTMRPFKAIGYRAKEVLDLVHADICGPMFTSARGGYEYFITFIDDYSRYAYVYLMRHKSETFKIFKEYKAKVENHRGKSIKSLRSDRGGEYLFSEFRQYLKNHKITSKMSAPDQPQQNGVAERRNQTLLDMVRSMNDELCKSPKFLLRIALETAQYILNLVPSKVVSTIPDEF